MLRKEYKKSYAKFVASYFVGGLLSMFSFGLLLSTMLMDICSHLPVIILTCLASFLLGAVSFHLSFGYEKDANWYQSRMEDKPRKEIDE